MMYRKLAKKSENQLDVSTGFGEIDTTLHRLKKKISLDLSQVED